MDFPYGSAVKCLPAMQKTCVQSLGQEYPLEKEMATHSSVLPWKIPWREEPGGPQFVGLQRVGHNWAIPLSFHLKTAVLCPLPLLFSTNLRLTGFFLFYFLFILEYSCFTELCYSQVYSRVIQLYTIHISVLSQILFITGFFIHRRKHRFSL